MSDDPDSDHERSAAICRRAALPMLRQRPAMVRPEADEGDLETRAPEAAGNGSRPAPDHAGPLDAGVWGLLLRRW